MTPFLADELVVACLWAAAWILAIAAFTAGVLIEQFRAHRRVQSDRAIARHIRSLTEQEARSWVTSWPASPGGSATAAAPPPNRHAPL